MYQREESTKLQVLLENNMDAPGREPFVSLRKWTYHYEVAGDEGIYTRDRQDVVLRYGISGEWGSSSANTEEHVEVLDENESDFDHQSYAFACYNEMATRAAMMRETDAKKQVEADDDDIPF